MAELRRVPVTISGDWKPVAHVGHVRWEGTATADEPITALALGRDRDIIQWARAGREESNTLSIALAVFPVDTSDNRCDVHMRLSVGSSGLQATLRLSTTAPFMFSLNHHVTGAPAWFARPHTKDRFDFGALFITTADTRSARNHLWHLREGVSAPDIFAEALGYGRTGQIKRNRV